MELMYGPWTGTSTTSCYIWHLMLMGRLHALRGLCKAKQHSVLVLVAM
jgi:hypothetical protein